MTREQMVALHDSLRASAEARYRDARLHRADLRAELRLHREAARLDGRADALAAQLVVMDDGPAVIACALREVCR